MERIMNIVINGNKKEIISKNLKDLIETIDIKKSTLVIEHNGSIIQRDKWETATLKENDQLELITMVGGG